jgi:predicted nuclease of predicted toxin-antitoxin system
MKLLVDMNLSPRWASLLTDAGLEAVHWSTVGQTNARDTEIMAWAAANGYTVLTHDLEFSAILAATQDAAPSVVQIRTEDISPALIGAKVIAALHQMKSELEAGALLSIDVNHTRLRLLPLTNREGNL